MWIATAEQMREIDRRAIEEFGLPSRVLMERAGYAVFEKLRQMLPTGGSIAVACGKGNNGGDGFVIARLAHQAGYLVDCVVAAKEEDLSQDARAVLEPLKAAGIHPCFVDSEYWMPKLQALAAHDLVVDALLGTGAKGQLKGPIEEAIHAINRSEALVLAVDVPSGIETDTGKSLGAAVVADATVTFGLPKPFPFCTDGLECSGDWSVAEIGFPTVLLKEPTGAQILDCHWVADRLPIRNLGSNKGDNGHVLIVAGSHRMRGAPTLCAQAALRAGSGLVTVAAPEEVCAAVAAQIPEALLLPLPNEPKDAAKLILDHKADVGLFGPGLTHEPAILELLANVFQRWDRPALIDADALNAISLKVDLPNAPCVLTPHPGEAGRLMEKSAKEIEANRFENARDLAEKYRQTILLKGRHSIVSMPDKPLLVNPTGNAGMATGGSGDTLSGIIASLLGQGLEPYDAAAVGMYWHGLAADQCAQSIGSIGYSPSEVAKALPKARDTIIETCNSDL